MISCEAVQRSTGIFTPDSNPKQGDSCGEAASSCGPRGLLPEHGGDLLPAVNSPQPDLPARHEAEEQHEGRVLARQGALRLHAPAEFFVEPLNRFVVRSVFHCALGNRKNVSSSSPPSRRLVTTPGHRLPQVRSKVA